MLCGGKRFHSAQVVRLADAKRMELGHALKADGRWRIIAFAPKSETGTAEGPVAELCRQLTRPDGFLARVTPKAADMDAVIDLRVVLQHDHRKVDLASLPAALLPRKGALELTDYEKVFCPDQKAGDIFDLRGIHRDMGAVIVVRPDQYVSMVVPFSGIDAIETFFDGIFRADVPGA